MPRFILLARLVSIALVAAVAHPASCAEAKNSKTESADDDSVEQVIYNQDGQQRQIEGRVITEAADGGLLVQSDDGKLWMIEGGEVAGRHKLDASFTPLSPKKLSERLLAEFPTGFRIHTTPHYVICFNTSREYAQWTSSLLERLYKAFTNYWESQGLQVEEPEFPLVVQVFADRQMYDQASRDDLPGGTGNIVGFYSLRSNRVNMFDLTGAEAVRDTNNSRQAGTARRGSMREISQMLSQPAAVPLVATIVHEATHQIAFNCGLQQRFADIPLWLCEGMAVYFEAPDLSSTRGWTGIGRVNYPRLNVFRNNLPNWHEGELERMLADNRRFRNPQTAPDAYADAWALNYYLIKFEPKAYTAYLKALAEKRPLIEDEPTSRLAEFREHFGNLRDLEQEFLKQMSRVK